MIAGSSVSVNLGPASVNPPRRRRDETTTEQAEGGCAPAGSARHLAWDRELPRFGVKVSRGGAKSYVVQYRASGRVRRYTIGRHGAPWTPDTARAEALRVLEAVARGKDPAGAKIGARTAPTVAALVARFLSEHVAAKCKPKTAAEYRRLCETLILPALGPRHVADVSRPDVARLHHRHRATPYQANRLLAVCGKLFGLAERWGLRAERVEPLSARGAFPRGEADAPHVGRGTGPSWCGARAGRARTPQAPDGRDPSVPLRASRPSGSYF